MKCQLIQTSKIAEDNKAEQEMLAFLRALPADYYVYRELQVTPAYEKQLLGVEKQKPDFVVVAPEIGLLSIEVKDWNLTTTTYEWLDQYKIRRTYQGKTTDIDNPAAQADGYRWAFKDMFEGSRLFVTSIVAFPRLARMEFLNSLPDAGLLENIQTKFYLNLSQTLFRDDLDQYRSEPEKLLRRVVQQNPRFKPSSPRDIFKTNSLLLPPSFRIGDYTKRQQNRTQLQMITDEQQRWVYNLDSSSNYLLDVPGSGKTNALISKAIYLVDQAGRGSIPRILLTTYSRTLETNIKRIFAHKIANSPNRERYINAISVQSVPTLLEAIVMSYFDDDDIEGYRSLVPGETQVQYEKRLQETVVDILDADADRFRQFDYLFIDEIQDFDNPSLIITAALCKTKNYFFVGDIGQKIYKRTHDLNRLGLVTDRVVLPQSHKMFRTPRYIAELANRFLLGARITRDELEQHGYNEQFQYPNTLEFGAALFRSDDPVTALAEKVQDLLAASYTEDDILVIASSEQQPLVEAALDTRGIRYAPGVVVKEGHVCLADFMSVKGLEKEVVLVTGIEDLPDRTTVRTLFADEEDKVREERFSRRKIYVSLTRPLEQLYIYYHDANNRFVSELCNINRQIVQRRQGGTHGLPL